MIKDERRETLKALLQGKVMDAAEVVRVLKGVAPEIISVLQMPDGSYTVDGKAGLSKDEMKVLTQGKRQFKVKILASPIPVFNSEKELEEWLDVTPDYTNYGEDTWKD